MATFTSMWWMFILSWLVLAICAGLLHFKNLRNFVISEDVLEMKQINLIPTFVFAALSALSFILGVIATILMFIQQSKA